MNLYEDRSNLSMDAQWFTKGYAKEDVCSLCLQFLYTEEEQAANCQFRASHTDEEWMQRVRKTSEERSAWMESVMDSIAQKFICYQYDKDDPTPYDSNRWEFFFWCNHFQSFLDLSGRDYSYITLSFNERQTVDQRMELCQRVLEFLRSRFQEHPNLNVTVKYAAWFNDRKIHAAIKHITPQLQGRRYVRDQKEGKLFLQDDVLLFKPKYAKKYVYRLSPSEILALGWEFGLDNAVPDAGEDWPPTLPYDKFGDTHPIQLQVTSYLDGNLAIEMIAWDDGTSEPWATLTVNLPGRRQKDHAFIDTNADSEFPIWLIRHGLARPTGRTMQSGFCTYPEYRFRADKLKELDPEGYASYTKQFEGWCSA